MWPLDEDLTNEELRDILFPNRHASETKYAMPDFPYIHRELTKPGVNLTLLWTEYCKQCGNEGHAVYVHAVLREVPAVGADYKGDDAEATMRIQHKPGDAMQVDWAGNTLDIYDSVTDEVSKRCASAADSRQSEDGHDEEHAE